MDTCYQHFSALTVCYFIRIRCHGCQIWGSMQHQLILIPTNPHCSSFSCSYCYLNHLTVPVLTLLPAYQLYQTVPISQPASLAAPLLPTAAVFTFDLLDHCCLRGRGGYSSPSSQHVCDFSTFLQWDSSLSTQLLCTQFLSLWLLHVSTLCA